MKAGEANVGGIYESPSGALVTVAGYRDRKVVLIIRESKSEVLVSRSYPLRHGPPLPEESISLTDCVEEENVAPPKKPKAPPLSRFIDPLLLSGRMAVRDIVDALKYQLGDSIKGRDLGANVRARIFHLKRRRLLATNAAR